MRLFDTVGADAAYDRYFNPPDLHEDDDCEECHKLHIGEGVVEENALKWHRQFPCCVTEQAEREAAHEKV